MQYFRRLSLLCLAALALAPAAQAATTASAGGGPSLRAVSGLRGFALSASDQATHEFSRTPSFAWSPVAGAKGYEFELSTSNSFAPNAIVWSSTTLKSPTVAIPLSLPWITGSPYSLYAHVRATTPGGIGAWSSPYGFNMRWTAVPKPMQSQPGLVRWTPVAGATSYEVWFVDAGHLFDVGTNVADEREYYTFHHGLNWSGVVHWRVRAHRHLYGSTANGLPVNSSGPWSPVYTSYNPPFQVGSLTTGSAVSDTVSNGSSHATHQLMPGFAFTGNRSGYNGVTTELYRVYVFSDRDCLNVVYTGAVVGSPAYAPRPTGPLGLPQSSEALLQARGAYVTTGGEGSVFSADGDPITSSEVASTTDTGTGGSTGGGTGDGSTKSGGTDSSGSSAPSSVLVKGAKTDLWDDDWSNGGYYWTVVPVAMVSENAKATTLAVPAGKDATAIVVTDSTDIVSGDVLSIGSGAIPEVATVATVDGNTVTLESTLKSAHGAGEKVMQISGGIQYYDTELTQDACASGRVQTFAKSSTPTVTSGTAPFATGLSTRGRLVAASKARPVFYGTPLVSWEPADAAVGYEVQWSRTKYPWKAAGSAQTFATASVLKLTPGTWYYRVRGFDPYIPGTHHEMSWSSVASLTVARPSFKVVSG
jgi:hypothetical protein